MRAWVARIFAIWFLFLSLPSPAQQPVESGKWKLYKFEQPIGEESYELHKTGDGVALTDHFLFTDRGTPVPLETTFRGSRDLTPATFETKGKVSRQATIDASVTVADDTVTVRERTRTSTVSKPPVFFTISGYSPIAQQMLMLRYWLAHGRPASLRILPQATDVRILDRGTESVEVSGKSEKLTRYSVAGLIWGRESLWMDERQDLVAAVTTDAESITSRRRPRPTHRSCQSSWPRQAPMAWPSWKNCRAVCASRKKVRWRSLALRWWMEPENLPCPTRWSS